MCITLPRMTDVQRKREPGWIPDLTGFGARLALVRQHMGWGNVKQAASLCGIAVETWRTWERDNVAPKHPLPACMKIAGVTGVDYRWLALGPVDHSGMPMDQSAAVTQRYAGIGERVVATGIADWTNRTRPKARPQSTSARRTSPLRVA